LVVVGSTMVDGGVPPGLGVPPAPVPVPSELGAAVPDAVGEPG
jgi:hypothetical protein